MQLLRADFQRIYLDVMMWIVYMAVLYSDVLFSSTAGLFCFEMRVAGLCSSCRSRRYISHEHNLFFTMPLHANTQNRGAYMRVGGITLIHSHESRRLHRLLLYFTSWKCPVLLWGWLCQMWHIHHLVIAFVIKFFRLVTHKGHSILPN